MAICDESVIVSDAMQMIPHAGVYHFGILTSAMHMAWMRTVAGRLEMRYLYSPFVYNNFPWSVPTTAQREKIEACAQGVLNARAKHPESTLADLYDPLLMRVCVRFAGREKGKEEQP